MPTYDYKCTECGDIFEKFHGMSESPDVSCPGCDSVAHKQIGAGSGIVFKGSGFYTTDYKNQKSCPANEGGKTASKVPPCSTGNCPAV